MSDKDFVSKVIEFNTIASNTGEYNPQKMGLYVGLILEELHEMLESINMNDTLLSYYVSDYATKFKSGVFNESIFNSTNNQTEKRKEFLDAAVDIAVVSIGAGIAVGSDIYSACNDVADNNLTKFPLNELGYRVILKDSNGKVKKPDNYKSVDLTNRLV